MRYKISYSLPVELVDHDGSMRVPELVDKLDGLACTTDTVLNYAELPFGAECAFRGGHPRLVVVETGRLSMAVELDCNRKLKRDELRVLCDDLAGQLTDGIGAGCFDMLTVSTGLSVQLRTPSKPKCSQGEGVAWRPTASTDKGNRQKLAAAAKLIKKADKSVVSGRAAKSSKKGLPAGSTVKAAKRPNFKALFRFLAKPERNQFFNQIKTELEAIGNDLSMVADGEYPYGNLSDPKLLRLLLDAGLPPETTDVMGCSLLIQAACESKCLELLLKRGAAVNRVCDNYVAATALIRAASIGKLKSVQFLLSQGADPKIKDKSGETAIDHVDQYSRNSSEIEKVLRSATRR